MAKRKDNIKTIEKTLNFNNNEDLLMNSSKEVIETKKQIINEEIKNNQIFIKDKTSFNQQLENEEKLKEENNKLPLDKILDIAKQQGLLKDLTEEQRFDRLIKGINLHDIIKDCMQSSLDNYCKEYNKVNPDDNLNLKLHLRKATPKNNIIFSTNLVLESRRRGLYKVLLSHNVSFNHVREVRDEKSWKYSLYGNMFNSLITNSINHLLLTDDVKSGRIRQDISQGDSNN